MSNPIGRPLMFDSLDEFNALVDEYFTLIPEEDWTWTGMCIHIGTTRETLREYKARPEFVDAIKKALHKVEYSYERDLKKHGRTGTIFALKNFGWKDQSEVLNKNMVVEDLDKIESVEEQKKAVSDSATKALNE